MPKLRRYLLLMENRHSAVNGGDAHVQP